MQCKKVNEEEDRNPSDCSNQTVETVQTHHKKKKPNRENRLSWEYNECSAKKKKKSIEKKNLNPSDRFNKTVENPTNSLQKIKDHHWFD